MRNLPVILPALTMTLVLCQAITAQNLVPNPSFEEYTVCPDGWGNPTIMDCAPWFNANDGTCDYYHPCSSSWVSDVPLGYHGYQHPRTGEAFTGLYTKFGNLPWYWYEYLQVPLNTPLVAGHTYHVAFYVNLSNKHCAGQYIGAYLSVGEIHLGTTGVLPYTPQVESNMGWINDTLNWTLIEGCVIATGGEDHLTIGNFRSYDNTPIQACTAELSGASYYLVDDVSVIENPFTGIEIEMEDEVSTCYAYTIIPEVDPPGNYNYVWSNGFTSNELTVNTSGEYKVTIYDNQCRGAIDSIQVTITNQPPVEFDPADTVICTGESITIVLDPDAGEYEWSDGSSSSQYSIITTGIFSVTLDDGCDLSTDEILVEVLDPPPAFTLGNDTILCEGSEIEFNFDPMLGEFLWQDGSQSSYVIIFQEGTYALTISNVCGQSIASVFVEEIGQINVNLGPAEEIICTNETLEIFLDDAYATYLWQDGSTASAYEITSAGTYTVTMTHVCGTSIDSINIAQLSIPAVALGPDIIGCPWDSLIFSSPGNTGAYLWQDGSTNDSLLITSAGIYSLAITNACGSDQDSVTVQFEDLLLPVDLGPDVNLCPGEQLILYSDNTGAPTVWQNGSTLDSLIVSGVGVYHVTVSNACFTFSDTLYVDVGNTPPVIDLASQVVLCEGSSTTIDPGVDGVWYLWSDGTIGATLSVSTSGTYSLTVSNSCGSDVDTIEVIDGGPLPSVDLGSDISLCPGDVATIEPDFQNVDTWTWPDGTSTTTYTSATAGVIGIHVTNSCGSTVDSVTISLLEPAPVLDVGRDTALCDGEEFTLTIVTPDVSILWNNGSTDPSLIIAEPGTYFATISNTCGEDSDSLVVSELPGIPLLDLGPDLPLCPGETITLDPGIVDVDYTWQDGSTNTTFIINTPQTITLTITNDCGTSTDDLTIYSSTDGPDVDLGSDLLACEGESVTIQSNISGVDYLWNDGSGNSSLSTSVSGMYSLSVSNSCGTDMDTIVVDIRGTAPSPDLGQDTLLCEGTSLILVSDADAETTIEWQDGSTLTTYIVNMPGTYTLRETNRCGEMIDSINITYQSLPLDFDLGPDTVLCTGENVLLSGPSTTDVYTWQDGSDAPTFMATQSGLYVLMIHNDCGLKTDSVHVSYADMIVVPAEPIYDICPGESIMIDVSQNFPATYSWSTNSNQPLITVITPGAYNVSIITECETRSQEFIVEIDTLCLSTNEYYIPNIFSPNEDHVNDVFGFFPKDGMKILSLDGSIYDRWGELVYQSQAIPFTWDGMFNGKVINPGVFVYSINVEYEVNTQILRERIMGDVTVIK